MRIQLNNKPCLFVPGKRRRWPIEQPVGAHKPPQWSSKAAPRDTISTVYCLYATHSVRKMTCEIWFVWRSCGCLMHDEKRRRWRNMAAFKTLFPSRRGLAGTSSLMFWQKSLNVSLFFFFFFCQAVSPQRVLFTRHKDSLCLSVWPTIDLHAEHFGEADVAKWKKSRNV